MFAIIVWGVIFFVLFLVVFVVDTTKKAGMAAREAMDKFDCTEQELVEALNLKVSDNIFELVKLTKTQFRNRLERARMTA